MYGIYLEMMSILLLLLLKLGLHKTHVIKKYYKSL